MQKRYSVMDLGRDSPVLCLHCHKCFCSRSIRTTETSRTSFELQVSCFLVRTFVLSSWSSAVPDVRAFLKKTPANDFVRLPTARVGTRTGPNRFSSLPTPAEHLFSQRCHRQCRPSIFRHACVVGQTVEQALTARDHSDGQVLLPFVRQNSSPNQLPHTTLLPCILPSPEHLDMHWLRPQKQTGWFFSQLCSCRS